MMPSDTDIALAQLISLVSIAETSCQGKVVGDARPVPVLPVGLRLVGLITAKEIYFGFLATDGVRFYVVIRGTEHFLEWIEDAEFGMVDHPFGGRVEVGFWSVYGSLRYEGLPLISGLREVIGAAPTTVTGHSLGGPLADYIVVDLAKSSPASVACRPFASPKPGDAAFAARFANTVPDHLVINYELDLVPRLPIDEDFVAPPNVRVLKPSTSTAWIRLTVACGHHATSYAALLDYGYAVPNGACVLGPRQPEAEIV